MYETRFYHIMHRYMQVCPTPALPGAAKWLDNVLQDGNQVTVLTSLPRSLAVKALKQSKLSSIFEGHRVNPDLLVSPLHLPPDTGDPTTTSTSTSANPSTSASFYNDNNSDGGSTTASASSFAILRDGATLLKCCGLMRKPAVLTTMLSGNRRTLLSAKRLGLTTIAVQGYSQALHELRMADKVRKLFVT